MDADAANAEAQAVAVAAGDVRTAPAAALAAAHQVIAVLRCRPNQHSVWVMTDVTLDGEFRDRIAVAINPNEETGAYDRVPERMGEFDVVRMPWGDPGG